MRRDGVGRDFGLPCEEDSILKGGEVTLVRHEEEDG